MDLNIAYNSNFPEFLRELQPSSQIASTKKQDYLQTNKALHIFCPQFQHSKYSSASLSFQTFNFLKVIPKLT